MQSSVSFYKRPLWADVDSSNVLVEPVQPTHLRNTLSAYLLYLILTYQWKTDRSLHSLLNFKINEEIRQV